METNQIRKATIADIPAIIAVIDETWEPTYRSILSLEQVRFMQHEIYNSEALRTQMESGQDFFLLLEKNQPAGFASLSPVSQELYKLNKIYVKPQYQGRRFGLQLIRHVEEVVRQRQGRYLSLNVNRFNDAKNFYEKLGFAVVREEDIPIGPYWMNDYVLQKAV